MCRLIAQTLRRAVKPHVCDLCRRAIGAGEQYQRRIYKDGGSAYALSIHLDCLEAYAVLRDELGAEDSGSEVDFYELDKRERQWLRSRGFGAVVDRIEKKPRCDRCENFLGECHAGCCTKKVP